MTKVEFVDADVDSYNCTLLRPCYHCVCYFRSPHFSLLVVVCTGMAGGELEYA